MIRHHLRHFLAQMRRTPASILSHLAGFTIALTCCILAASYIFHERSFDSFHYQGERTYRLYKKNVSINDGVETLTAETSGMMGPTLKDDYPQVANYTRLMPWFEPVLITKDTKTIEVNDFVFADSSFFDVFSFDVLRGNPSTMLVRPSSIVLTSSIAKTLYGDSDPIGQSLTGLQDIEYTVTGVIADPPVNSHIQFETLVSWSTTVPEYGPLEFSFMNNWLGQTLFTYIVLREGSSAAELESQLGGFMERHFPERKDSYFLYLQPLNEVHLYSEDIRYGRSLRIGSIKNLKIFTVVAFFILILACVNYINMSTARAAHRSAEIGIRKALGAERKQLIYQFLIECAVIIVIAWILSYLLADLFLSSFNQLTGSQVPVDMLRSLPVGGVVLLIIVFTVLAAGAYPAIFLSGFRPARAIRMNAFTGRSGQFSRKLLIVVQFTISFVLLVGTLVVFIQMKYLQNRPLGFDKEHLLILDLTNEISAKHEAFRNEILSYPGVLSASACQATIGNGTFGTTVQPEGMDHELSVNIFRVDGHFMETLGLEIKEGRAFNTNLASDSISVVINETLADLLLADQAVGSGIRFDPDGQPLKVIGVVKDFNFEGLNQNIVKPVVMYIYPRNFNNMTIRLDGDDISGALSHIETSWKTYESKAPFSYYFADQWFDDQYRGEARFLSTISVFSFISVILAAMGLYGLTTFMIRKRWKEIGIRKVLGATLFSINLDLSRSFIGLVLISIVIGTPVIYFLMNEWLKAFAYRSSLDHRGFVFAGAIITVVALLSVGFQCFRASRMNPSSILREE